MGTASITVPGTSFPSTTTHNIFDYPSAFITALGGAPVVEAQYKIGSGDWQDFGDSMFIETNTTRFWIRGVRWALSSVNIDIRYWVMNDKVAN